MLQLLTTPLILPLPTPFIQQMRALPGFDFDKFEAALRQPPPVSIRLNPKKISNGPLPEHWESDPVLWHPWGRYLPERPIFTLDPLLHAGGYYVQEAASMFLYEAIRQSTDMDKKLRVLDLCAAPGGKSTLLASIISSESLLVSNEVIRARTAPLRENMERWGHPNVAITSAEPEEFAKMEGFFEVIVADAPCSGEGLFRKDPNAMLEWSPAHVEFCAARQKKILASVVAALAPGGILVFSTCTYNSMENEENVQWMKEAFDLDIVRLTLPEAWGIVAAPGGGYHFFPHCVRGEGFFIVVLQKKSGETNKWALPGAFRSIKNLSKAQVPDAQQWLQQGVDARFFQTPSGEILALPKNLEDDYLLLDKTLKTKWFGVNIGEFKGKDFIPSHALALSLWANAELPAVELSLEACVSYLRKENFEIPNDTPRGWALVRYAGLNLGWMKVLLNRVNNYLPNERRILMRKG